MIAAGALLILALAAPAAGDGALAVRAHLVLGDAGTAGVGEPFALVIEAEHASGGIALLPADVQLGEKISERKQTRRHTREGSKDREIDRYELQLIAFEAGDLTIPSIPLAYGSTQAATPALEISVTTGFSEAELPVATSTRPEAMQELEKMAAQDPHPEVVRIDDFTIALVLGALALAGLIALLLRRATKVRRAEAPAPPPPPPRPAHEVALERLTALRKAGYLDRREAKAFYAELSEILREYIGARYRFDSLDLTVGELMHAIARVSAPGLDAVELQDLLERADLVKFAKYAPDLAESIAALEAGVDIVEKTKPRAPANGAAGSPEAPRPSKDRREGTRP